MKKSMYSEVMETSSTEASLFYAAMTLSLSRKNVTSLALCS